MPGKRGGISSETHPASLEVQSLVEQVKSDIESKLNAKFHTFDVHSYKTQVVAGRNYFVKVRIGDNKFLHLRIYKDLQQQVLLPSIQDNKSQEDEIEYF